MKAILKKSIFAISFSLIFTVISNCIASTMFGNLDRSKKVEETLKKIECRDMYVKEGIETLLHFGYHLDDCELLAKNSAQNGIVIGKREYKKYVNAEQQSCFCNSKIINIELKELRKSKILLIGQRYSTNVHVLFNGLYEIRKLQHFAEYISEIKK